MGLFKTIARCAETAVKLPVAAAWDVVSLGNMGEGTSTGKVLREHENKKQMDDLEELAETIKRIVK